MRILGFGKNGLHLGVREIPRTSNVCVVYGKLFLEIEETIKRWANPFVPPATEPLPEMFRMPPGVAAVARSTESALTLEPMLSFRLETFRQLL